MEKTVRIVPHEGVDPECGSFEVRVSFYFHWENNPGRRLRPEQVDQEAAKKQAQDYARSVS